MTQENGNHFYGKTEKPLFGRWGFSMEQKSNIVWAAGIVNLFPSFGYNLLIN